MRGVIPSERFEQKWTPEPNTGCHLWLGWVNHAGYGGFNPGSTKVTRNVLAHRYAWTRERGPIPVGVYVLHRCDQPACVNVRHLFPGTQADNLRDMCSKGRSKKGRPVPRSQVEAQRRSVARITIHEASQMRDLVRAGWIHREIAEVYGCNQSQVSRRVNGRTDRGVFQFPL